MAPPGRAEGLDLVMRFAGAENRVHPAVLWNEGGEATLVDAGMPGHAAAILELLEELGVPARAVKRIILTHQDLDHIGSAGELAERTGAQVMAHADDAPYIRGERRLIKLDPRRWEERLMVLPPREREAVERILAQPPRVRVDRVLSDGDELPWHGGIAVIHTPGHTPGHISLYARAARLLVAGDALRVEGGVLVGPSPNATLDLPEAMRSLRKLLSFELEGVLCYHGGFAGRDFPQRLVALAGPGGAVGVAGAA